MKKIITLIVFTVLIFNLKSFGGNFSSSLLANKLLVKPSIAPADTVKKTSDNDTASDDDDANVRSYAIGLGFGSDQSSHGIHSGNKLPYIEPSFTYSAPKGFYITVSDQFILSKDSGGFDAFALNPGWNIDLGNDNTLNFNLTHYWFRAKTPLSIMADLSDVGETYFDHWFGETEGRFTVDYDYYKKTDSVNTPGDIILTPDILHDFKFTLSKKSSLSLIPEGSIDFGTTNAYSHYLSRTKDNAAVQSFKRRKKSGKASFAVLDFNLIFTVNYKIGHFEIEPAINLNVPIYKVPGVPDKPLGFGTLNLIYTIE